MVFKIMGYVIYLCMKGLIPKSLWIMYFTSNLFSSFLFPDLTKLLLSVKLFVVIWDKITKPSNYTRRGFNLFCGTNFPFN